MEITKDIIRQTYTLLKATPPFNRWNLPDSYEIVFDTRAVQGALADYEFRNGKHIIRAAKRHFSQLDTLIPKVAHEMVHMRVTIKYPEEKGMHGTNFNRLAKLVCKHHGFDPNFF